MTWHGNRRWQWVFPLLLVMFPLKSPEIARGFPQMPEGKLQGELSRKNDIFSHTEWVALRPLQNGWLQPHPPNGRRMDNYIYIFLKKYALVVGHRGKQSCFAENNHRAMVSMASMIQWISHWNHRIKSWSQFEDWLVPAERFRRDFPGVGWPITSRAIVYHVFIGFNLC